MPTGEHESPIELAKLDPGLLVWLLANVFDIDVPKYDHARTARRQIFGCTDLAQLTTWLRRAIKATTIDDVLTA